MRINCCCSLPVLVLSGLLAAVQIGPIATANAAGPSSKAPAVTTYPQIVRLSYVEGDVRISRGKEAEKRQNQEPGETTGWEQATTNLPLQTGYSLVTGTGRAEIELEDASVVYLADNSVLTFNEISATNGVPYTEIALLSGTATLNVQTLLPGECFRLFTPGDSFTVTYPKKAYLRVNSYLDAIAVTPQQNVPWYAPLEERVGKTVTVHNGQQVAAPEMDTVAMAEWDKWVAQRVSARDAVLSAAMKDAGLTEPIPGLAEMDGQGKFFACAPYGTCWEPSAGWGGDKAELAQAETHPATASGSASAQEETQPAAPVERVAPSDEQAPPAVAGAQKATGQSAADAYLASHPGATLRTEDYIFPCSEFAVRDLIAMDPVTGKEKIVGSEFVTDGYPYFAGWPYTVGFPHRMSGPLRVSESLWGFDEFNGFNGYEPWDWGVCHAGSWIRWQHRYVWVAGTKRHHRRPVRWVKHGRTVGYVPVHPKDVKGKPPINLKDGIFKPTKKGDSILVARADFKEGKPVALMSEAPKEFRKPFLQPLERAEVPHAEAYSAHASVAGKGTAIAASAAGKGTATGSSPIIAKGTVKAGSAMEAGVPMRQPGMPINFDRKTQSFTVARTVTENGRPATVVQTIGRGGNSASGARGSSYGSAPNSGGAQSRPGSYSGSVSNGGGASRTYTPAPTYSPPARSYSPPAQSYSPPARSYSGGGSGGSGGGGGGGGSHNSGGSTGGGSTHR